AAAEVHLEDLAVADPLDRPADARLEAAPVGPADHGATRQASGGCLGNRSRLRRREDLFGGTHRVAAGPGARAFEEPRAAVPTQAGGVETQVEVRKAE